MESCFDRAMTVVASSCARTKSSVLVSIPGQEDRGRATPEGEHKLPQLLASGLERAFEVCNFLKTAGQRMADTP